MTVTCPARPGLDDYSGFFVSELTTVKAAVDAVSRKYRLPADEAEDLASEVYLKIVENDYAVLRKFQRRSSLRTYLTVVAGRVLLDMRTRQWGKWRPSAAAKRYGSTGVLFEQLMLRKKLSFDDACAALERTHGLEVD